MLDRRATTASTEFNFIRMMFERILNILLLKFNYCLNINLLYYLKIIMKLSKV